MYKKRVGKLFRTGGSVAIRIPKEWVPATDRVTIRKEGRSIIITEEGEDLVELARAFAKDGRIEFERPTQPQAPDARSL